MRHFGDAVLAVNVLEQAFCFACLAWGAATQGGAAMDLRYRGRAVCGPAMAAARVSVPAESLNSLLSKIGSSSRQARDELRYASRRTPRPAPAFHQAGIHELPPSMRSALDGVSGPLGPGQFLTQGVDTHTHGQCPRGSSVFSRQPASSALKATHCKFVMCNEVVHVKRRASPPATLPLWREHCAQKVG